MTFWSSFPLRPCFSTSDALIKLPVWRAHGSSWATVITYHQIVSVVHHLMQWLVFLFFLDMIPTEGNGVRDMKVFVLGQYGYLVKVTFFHGTAGVRFWKSQNVKNTSWKQLYYLYKNTLKMVSAFTSVFLSARPLVTDITNNTNAHIWNYF